MGDMGDLGKWSMLVGAFLPPLIAVIQQPKWSDTARAVTTVLVCIIVGGVTTEIEHGLHFDEHLRTSVLSMLIAAQATYQSFWKPVKVAPKIEAATSVT